MNCARNFLFSFCFGSSIFCRYFLFAGPGFKYSNPAAAVQPRPQHKSTSSCKHRAPAAVRGARTRGGLEHPGRRGLVLPRIAEIVRHSSNRLVLDLRLQPAAAAAAAVRAALDLRLGRVGPSGRRPEVQSGLGAQVRLAPRAAGQVGPAGVHRG